MGSLVFTLPYHVGRRRHTRLYLQHRVYGFDSIRRFRLRSYPGCIPFCHQDCHNCRVDSSLGQWDSCPEAGSIRRREAPSRSHGHAGSTTQQVIVVGKHYPCQRIQMCKWDGRNCDDASSRHKGFAMVAGNRNNGGTRVALCRITTRRRQRRPQRQSRPGGGGRQCNYGRGHAGRDRRYRQRHRRRCRGYLVGHKCI